MMKPSQTVLSSVAYGVVRQAKVHLDSLFCSGKADLSAPFVVLFYPNEKEVYEDAESYEVNLGNDCSKDKEYYVYRLRTLVETYDLNQLILQKSDETYQLKLRFVSNPITNRLELIYDPKQTIATVSASFRELHLPEHLCKEYLEVAHRFCNMRFHNHDTCGRYLQGIPKLTLSINGCVFNRPDREYYIVFGEGYDTYTVQVFKLSSDSKRESMLYGFWVNATHKRIYDPYSFPTY